MKRTLSLATASLATLALLAGCGKEDEVAEKYAKPEPRMAGNLEGQSPLDLIPTTPGTQVVYELTDQSGVRELTFNVQSIAEKPNGKEVTIQIIDNQGSVTDTTKWLVGETGVFQTVARNDQAFDPPQALVNYPITFSEPIKYEGNGPFAGVNATGKITGEHRIRGQEIVETVMGEIEALAIDSAYTYSHQGVTFLSRETTWIAPKFGIVRYSQTLAAQNQQGETRASTVNLRLKGFSEKG